MSLETSIRHLCRRARESSLQLASVSSIKKNLALHELAHLLDTSREDIAQANAQDLSEARQRQLAQAKLDRLVLGSRQIEDLIQGLHDIMALPDPVGEVTRMWTRPNGLQVGRMRIPLGVIGIIYESRPNVTIEAASLCLKSGNAVILRGGSESFHSNQYLASLLQKALHKAGLPPHAIQLVDTTDRAAVGLLLQQDDTIDVMIPRGGEELVRYVTEHARMPVLKHYKGVCHVYVDNDADLDMASSICINAKVQKPGVCNAMETLLVHTAIAPQFLPHIAALYRERGVSLRGCPRTQSLIEVQPATEQDWYEEYLDLILAIRVVDSMEDAIEHIHTYGSQHTEAIVTNHYQKAHDFLRKVVASLVLVNASTRFNDGFQLGLGAEMGISTSRLHAFGPMGLEELTTTKFFAYGSGQIRT